MTELETREKIFNIIREFNVKKRRYSTHTEPSDDDELADALIAVGIGDVKELKNKATAAELVAQVSASTAIEKIAEWKHRAEVAERALQYACKSILKDRNDTERRVRAYFKAYIDRAEKELQEEGKE